MKYIILTRDLGVPMYFMDHPYSSGFSISTNRERAKVTEGKNEAIALCNSLKTTSGFHCEFVVAKK